MKGKDGRHPRVRRVYARAERFCRGEILPFRSDASLMQAFQDVLSLRDLSREEKNAATADRAAAMARDMTAQLHARIDVSPDKVRLAGVAREHRLDRLEREILILLCLSGLGMTPRAGDIEQVQSRLCVRGRRRLAVARAFAEKNRLEAAGLILIEPEEIPVDSKVIASPELLKNLVHGSRGGRSFRKPRTYKELLERCAPIVRVQRDKSETLDHVFSGLSFFENRIKKLDRRIRYAVNSIGRILDNRPRWPLRKMFTTPLKDREREILIALIGRELGFLPWNDDLFSG